MKRITLALLAFLALTNMAEARRYGVRHTQSMGTAWATTNPMFAAPIFQEQRQPHQSRRVRGESRYASQTQIIAHPAGCPRRAFCGCGLAVSIFGSPRRDLWLAANWLRFPKASPAPGMVAARRGHVFKLVSPASSGNWVVEDYNSGRGLSRIHERSLAGYIIVNPRG